MNLQYLYGIGKEEEQEVVRRAFLSMLQELMFVLFLLSRSLVKVEVGHNDSQLF